ncbi:hypothetical protein [Pleionea litopenaei]|uniref:Uncharacterized protein n=1 Tax=Pleionea litopenaei TaxID=3070815 RepID=A0AA51RWX1_9GAMM|nr:hypothetical protein [Pleionea sp. HL-JVS1]WMS89014.1 hypothetical protein Q9312_08880 [Pleionea sp. HL-JVS1]
MLKVSSNKLATNISGSASEIAALARDIKKSKHGTVKEIGTDQGTIELICNGMKVEISCTHDKVAIQYSEASKNELYSLVSMPSDTTVSSVFSIRPIDHEQLFGLGSMGLELIVE